jgi:hypothetical protein
MVKFAAAIRPYLPVLVAVTDSDPTLLFAMDVYSGLDLWCADSASQRFWTQASRHGQASSTVQVSCTTEATSTWWMCVHQGQ